MKLFLLLIKANFVLKREIISYIKGFQQSDAPDIPYRKILMGKILTA